MPQSDVTANRQNSLEKKRTWPSYVLKQIWLKQLKKAPIYGQIAKRLLNGQSARKVAKWCVEQKVEGYEKDWGFSSWFQRILVVAEQTKKISGLISDQPASPIEVQAVKEYLAREPDPDLVIPEGARSAWKQLRGAVKSLDSEMMLKACFLIQQERVMEIREFEKKAGIPLAVGNEAVKIWKEIAAEIRKHEVGEQWMKGKIPGKYGAAPEALIPQQPDKPMGPLAEQMSKLSVIDRNLIIAASEMVMDMSAEEVSRLEADLAAQAPRNGA